MLSLSISRKFSFSKSLVLKTFPNKTSITVYLTFILNVSTFDVSEKSFFFSVPCNGGLFFFKGPDLCLNTCLCNEKYV